MVDDDKRAAAIAAAAEVRDGMIVGLGTGSTAAHLLTHLSARVGEGLRISAVATSLATESIARRSGIPVIDFAAIAAIDLAIDGVDEIDDHFRAIKGRGGAMLREKIVASAAARMIAIADGSKRVAAIGRAQVPVETLPFARRFVTEALAKLGCSAVLRMRGSDAYLTDQGNLVLDCTFADLDDPQALAAGLSAIPGVLGHGLFPTEIDAAYIAVGGVVTRLERSPSSG